MADFKTWLEAFESSDFDAGMIQVLINEAQKTHFIGNLPAGFAFLRGAFLDLGFDNLGQSPEALDKIRRAFVGNGLAVAGTACRLRNMGPGRSVVEPLDGSEQATLPDHWKEAVVVLGYDEKYTWIGKRVRQEQLVGTDLRDYEDIGDGWHPKEDRVARSTFPSD